MKSLWDNVTNKAWDEGRIVYAMDQMQTEGGKPGGGLTDGYCFGLASVWVKLRWQLQDYEYDANAYEYWGTDWTAVAVQKLYDGEMPKSEDVFVPVKKCFDTIGLKINYGRSQYTSHGLSGSGLYSAIKKSDGFYVVGMKGTHGAHAIAIANLADEVWRLFDGNYGLFKIEGNNEFYLFLADYFKSGGTGYARKYSGGWFTACALPTWA